KHPKTIENKPKHRRVENHAKNTKNMLSDIESIKNFLKNNRFLKKYTKIG
ncbi:hypothetical protein CGSMWGv6420B_00360, partial [Gardnerella vaginalis 6420B]